MISVDVVNIWNASVPAPLHNVSLQHRFLGQNASEAKGAQVQRLKVSIQDQFSHCPTHRRGVLQAMAAETGGKVHVVDQGVNPDDAVLVQGVVLVEPCPRAFHLRGETGRSSLPDRNKTHVLTECVTSRPTYTFSFSKAGTRFARWGQTLSSKNWWSTSRLLVSGSSACGRTLENKIHKPCKKFC